MNTTFADPNVRAKFLQESRELLPLLAPASSTVLIRAINVHAEALHDAFDHIEALEAELRAKNDELHTLRFIGQQPETLTGKPPGTLDIAPGPPTLIQRIKAAIAAFKRN